MRRREAFTLVELLVVIGIIALLISILLPALSKAQRQARSIQCSSNLRQLAQAFQMYVTNTRAKAMPYDASVNGFWATPLYKDYGQARKLLFCPEATNTGEGYNRRGTATCAWGPKGQLPYPNGPLPYTDIYSSYTINGWAYLPYTTDAPTLLGYSQGQPKDFVTLLSSHTDEIPLFADGIWVDGWPKETDPIPADLNTGDPTSSTGIMGRYCIARHGKAVNVVFMDAHARTVPLAELWQLRWSNAFTPKSVTIR